MYQTLEQTGTRSWTIRLLQDDNWDALADCVWQKES
jgi:hypothetical protein